MTIEEARKYVAKNEGKCIWGYEPGDDWMKLDGTFTLEELEAMVMVIRADREVKS